MRRISARPDIPHATDHARDHDDHARDHDDHARDQLEYERRLRLPEQYQFARNYPDPLTGRRLQIFPARPRAEFSSEDDFWTYMDALSRRNSGLPPARPVPAAGEIGRRVPAPEPPRSSTERGALRSRHVGLRLSEADHRLLAQLARAHAVPVGTMARILVVRGVRAAADDAD